MHRLIRTLTITAVAYAAASGVNAQSAMKHDKPVMVGVVVKFQNTRVGAEPKGVRY